MVESKHTSQGRRGKRVGLWLGGIVVLLAALYFTGWYFTNSRVPEGTDVAGVDIGGMTAERARDRLESARLTDDYAAIQVRYGEETFPVEADDVGLAVDSEETVSRAGAGRSWNPVQIVASLLGRHGRHVKPVISWDDTALTSVVDDISSTLESKASEPEVRFTDAGRPEVTPPRVGVEVDETATGEAIVGALTNGQAAEVVATRIQPDVGKAELAASLEDLGVDDGKLQPLTVQLPARTEALKVSEYASALTLEVVDGKPQPVVDDDKLQDGARDLIDRVGVAPVNASVRLQDGKPVVVRAQPGVELDTDELSEAVAVALTKTGDDRAVTVGTRSAPPDFSTREARELQVDEVVSDFVTYFPYAEYRNINQSRAAELISGTLLKPGELFSFNDTVGERTKANGFVVGFVISNGVFAEDLGGGVSQVVTTTYNAAFFAGLEDVAHTPHSFYIDRYPLGREATVAWPTVDLKFRNSTPYGVLIEAWVVPSTESAQGEMHVRMWSSKYWDIDAGVSERYDFTNASTRYDPTDACVATTGYGGFDVDVYRYFRKPGATEIVDRETDHVTYTPADTVICAEQPAQR